MKIIWKGWVDEVTGKFKPDELALYLEHIKRLKGKRVDVTIELHRKKRSLAENNYMWGVVYAAFLDLGYETVDEVHDALRWELLRLHRDGLPDTVISTTGLTTVQMEDYLEGCRRIGARMGLNIPLPNEHLEDEP